MEPVSMTVGAIVAKARDRAAEASVEAGEGVVRGLVARLRRRFSDAGDDEAAESLALVERAPDSPSLVAKPATAVDRHASQDTGFAAELSQLIDRARDAGVVVGSISQVARGDQNVQSAGISDSSISVSYGQPPPSSS